MQPATTASDASPFHPGEREVQTLAGVRDEAEQRGRRMLTRELNPQQTRFFSQLPVLISSPTINTSVGRDSTCVGAATRKQGDIETAADGLCRVRGAGTLDTMLPV